MWRCTFCFKEVAQQLEIDTYNRLWLPGQVCEESWIACYERTTDQVVTVYLERDFLGSFYCFLNEANFSSYFSFSVAG